MATAPATRDLAALVSRMSISVYAHRGARLRDDQALLKIVIAPQSLLCRRCAVLRPSTSSPACSVGAFLLQSPKKRTPLRGGSQRARTQRRVSWAGAGASTSTSLHRPLYPICTDCFALSFLQHQRCRRSRL